MVFLIIGLVIFGIYYFGFVKPAREDLDRTRTAALSEIDQTLGTIGTSKAQVEASSLRSSVIAAKSKSEINSILGEMSSIAPRESKRKELLDRVDAVVAGTYHSASDVEALYNLRESLKSDINKKTTLADLESFEDSGAVDSQATSTWRTYFRTSIENKVNEFNQVLQRTAAYSLIMPKENALALVDGSSWSTLRGFDFDNPKLVAVPIADTFSRAPDLRPGMVADIFVYDIGTENSSFLFGPAVILDTIYSTEDLSTVSWFYSYDTPAESYAASYSVDVWETLKALAAGSAEAAAVDWQSYATDIMERVRSADLGRFEISVMYVVAVPEELGILITQYEQYTNLGKDLILLPPIVSSNAWQYQAYQSYY
ncbi:MAG: hypothetical protein AVW06_01715 [Hadesarchaea archaeon DG-33-1]|nr:MAG: hypothetical protein AVW06_01715 [Hadesarchaea archaeon DG-33-1]